MPSNWPMMLPAVQAAAEQALASREFTAHVQQDVHSLQHRVIGPAFG
jgi:hypothetical protein